MTRQRLRSGARGRAVEGSFDRAVQRAGVRRLTPHGMRHTMATLMAAAGIHPSVIAQRMGHTSPAMTLKHYTSVSLDMQREGVGKLADALEGADDQSVRRA